jgi:uncharacterized protein
MKLSRFTLFYDNYPKADEALIYNTRTQSVIQLDPPARAFINKIKSEPPVDCCLLSTKEQEYLAIATENGMIIDDNVDEDKVLEHWFNRIKYQTDKLQATILTTYKCNFACTYCIEERVKQPKNLEPQTVSHIIQWLCKKVEEKRPKSLRLMFYGGEPLMNQQPIMAIASAMKAWLTQAETNPARSPLKQTSYGARFSFGMITNGSLVNPEVVASLKPLGLTGLSITLDGTKEMHDKRRPYLDGRGSFNKIVENISSVADEVAVDINGNFDRGNLVSLYQLLDYLEEKGLSKKVRRLVFAPVINRMGENKGGVINTEAVGCHSLSGEMGEEAFKLRKEIIRRGYGVDPAVVIMSCPMGHDDSMVVIDPYGDIYKCAAFVGRKEFSVGNVSDNGNLNYRNTELMTINPWKECKDCAYVPMCGGGCRFMAQLKHSDYTKVSCDKEYYEKLFPELLKMEFERGAL